MVATKLGTFARTPLLFGPSPVHPLPRLSAHLGGEVEIWAKREDVNSGLAFGGNKTRKLEYLVAEALQQGCDTLVSIGAIRLCARLEGMLTDPVYEGKSMAALIDLIRTGRIQPGSKVLYAHLGGQPALNACSGAF
jgi:1-aminocyclopropane-1-carboxylate deaminase/D-cysteine desulfhydrase-like pyridoxal-dependent ACC family enzyme